jgi:multidrug efflux pump subunit AcrA (membrane-fusion protein)
VKVLDRQRERRQYPRTRVAWPVLVEAGRRRHPCQAVDISAQGAKVSPKIWLRTGTTVRLQFVPPDGEPLRVGAMVWRVDADGLAFLFARSINHPVIRSA